MGPLEQIWAFYEGFAAYLHSADVSSLGSGYTKQELEHFQLLFSDVKLRNIADELLILLQETNGSSCVPSGIQHFPVLKEIDFLPEETKAALDRHLFYYKPGGFFSSIHRVVHRFSDQEKTLAFLKEHKILEKRFIVLCPVCFKNRLSSFMNQEEKDHLEFTLFVTAGEPHRAEKIEKLLLDFCHPCQYSVNFETLSPRDLHVKSYLKMSTAPQSFFSTHHTNQEPSYF